VKKERKIEIQNFLKKEGARIGKSLDEFMKTFLKDHLKDWKGTMRDDDVWTNQDQMAYEIFIYVIESLGG